MMAMWAETCLHEIMINNEIWIVNYILCITLYYYALMKLVVIQYINTDYIIA
jgi:hypothetical protein